MINLNDSIDVTIFMAMQISKKCLELGDNRPVLFLSNPGIGKSTAVHLFAEINGYEEELLRISNEAADTITGYDVAATNTTENVTSAVHIRPSWFQNILENDKKGKRTILFLDEITTADIYVQGAALNLVFDRKCHTEKLPDTTLIVAAGNYAQNLSSEMSILAPMLNRFIVVNLTPTKNDIPAFLCKFNGSIGGKRMDFIKEIKKAMKKLKDQEKTDLTEDIINKSGEIIENAIKVECMNLCGENKLDLAVTELKDIYSDTDNDDPVPNFCTLRSLNYLRDSAIACFICFGKEGLTSKNFKSMIHGTVGLGVTRKNNDIVKTVITDNFYKALVNAAIDIEKLNDKKLPVYEKFINDIISQDKLSIPNVDSLTKKINELINDKDLKKMEKPIRADVISTIFSKLKDTMVTLSYSNPKYKDNNLTRITETLKTNPETYIGFVTGWNQISSLVEALDGLIRCPEKKYERQTKECLNKFLKDARGHVHQLKIIKSVVKDECGPQFYATVPEIKPVATILD